MNPDVTWSPCGQYPEPAKRRWRCYSCSRYMPVGSVVEITVLGADVEGVRDKFRWDCKVCDVYCSRLPNSDERPEYGWSRGSFKRDDPAGWEAVRKEVEGDHA